MDAPKNTNPRQLILLAHGSSDPGWCRLFENGLAVINRHLDANACLAYMEMAAPGLETVIARHYLRGVHEFDILPLFFAEGRHLLQDVPERIIALERRHAGIDITLLEAVGHLPVFWEALGIMISTHYVTQPRQAR